jgi:hypothetical protein
MEAQSNYVKITLKKSSSKDGNVGYDIECNNSNATQEEMDLIATVALKTALKVRNQL